MTANLYPLPAPKPGYRFVPAKIGRRNATSVIVLIEDPLWCTEDHVAEPQIAIEDIVHASEPAALGVRSFLSRRLVFDMYASVKSEAISPNPLLQAAHVVVDDGNNEDAHLTPEMAEELADEMIGFASELRHLARLARQHNQAAGDSDPDMDEALRRVREGGVA